MIPDWKPNHAASLAEWRAAWATKPCAHCRELFSPSDRVTTYASAKILLYCSRSCKHKAYRSRLSPETAARQALLAKARFGRHYAENTQKIITRSVERRRKK